ncbi:hypothetical protein BUALT_Bualt02G0040100 [Buddleja alternifolia]|uniref:DUF4283 domain-containing protein n=1 Tax=Buddleja alternifolia TaxID=168488 RepID=A0AAV6Y1I9_9LAMI|nr:hypothetical protein BUALT_Bualt02G0040100 [Buddleja alternifolia]
MNISTPADPPRPVVDIDPAKISYAETLKRNPIPQELADRAAKKAFIHGVDSKLLEHQRRLMGKKRFSYQKKKMNSWLLLFNSRWLFDPNDYARVWMKQTWYFDGFPMKVMKWTADFDPSEESPIMPVWIKVFGLKPHWFHRQFLFHVASLVGKPLKLDEATIEISNPATARICVEVNVLEKLVNDIPIKIGSKICLLNVNQIA